MTVVLGSLRVCVLFVSCFVVLSGVLFCVVWSWRASSLLCVVCVVCLV